MAYRCDNCGKGSVGGISQRHKRGVAGRRWSKRAQATKRLFKPNLQATTLLVAGVWKRVRLCTRCIKKFKGEGKIKTSNRQTGTLGSLL